MTTQPVNLNPACGPIVIKVGEILNIEGTDYVVVETDDGDIQIVPTRTIEGFPQGQANSNASDES